MTRRSKTSSAISTTDSTEEPNHRLHWLPRLDRRVTICKGKGHTDHEGQGGRRAPSLLPRGPHPPLSASWWFPGPLLSKSYPSGTPFPVAVPRDFFCPSSPSSNLLNLHPCPLSFPFPLPSKPRPLWPPRGTPLFSLTATH